MQLSSGSHIPDGLLAANALLSEKPRLGVPTWNLAPHQGISEANCTAAIGLRASESLNRVWPRYTGKERDTESGLDYFGARYLSSNMGRFMSPDWSATADPVPYAKLDDPQTLNLYSYVGNNPLKRRDLLGHSADPCGTNKDTCVTVTATPDPPVTLWAGLSLWAGHHFIPKQVFSNWNSGGYARQLASRFTSGSLLDKSKNYYDQLHQAYNQQVQKTVADYLAKTGKSAEDLTASDFKAIVQELKDAGGAFQEFNARLGADESPVLKNVDEALGAAIKSFGEGAEKAIVETIEECEAGGNCIPPP